jgi:GNAT superfamily N-acetyltransferase
MKYYRNFTILVKIISIRGTFVKFTELDIKIVKADFENIAHNEAILFLLNEYAEDEMGGSASVSEYVRIHLIEELKKRNNAVILLAWDETIPVGLLISFEAFSTFYAKPIINIHDLVVIKKYRGKGISIQLLKELETVAKERGCCKMTLEVLEGNVRAQDVYKGFGFKGYELDQRMGKALFWEKKLKD